jgi:hypothetical protein
MGSEPNSSEGRFDGVGGPQVRPVLGREVVKGKEHFFVFLQAFTGLWKFDLVAIDELIVGCQSRFAGRKGRNQGINTGSPSHILGQNRTGKSPLVAMPDPWLANSDWTDSTDDLPLWQVSIAHHQSLSILILPSLVELDIVENLMLDRRL